MKQKACPYCGWVMQYLYPAYRFKCPKCKKRYDLTDKASD